MTATGRCFRGSSLGNERSPWSRRREKTARLPDYLRSPVFLALQGMVASISLFHFALERSLDNTPYYHFHYAVPILYLVPVILSGLHFRFEAARFTAVLAVLCALPNAAVDWPDRSSERITELFQLSVGLALGLTVASLLQQGQAQYRRAQDLSGLITLLYQQLTQAQEEERRRISRELHDETAQRLIILCRSLDSVAAMLHRSKAAAGPLRELRATAEQILADVRRFSRGLRPPILDDLGLVPALEWLAAESAKRHGFEARVEATGVPRRFAPETELALFRIAQESLHNVEKHAGASRVAITLAFDDGAFRLTVSDDGRGFQVPASPARLVADGKLGLMGMRERVELLGGTFGLHSQPGAGTCVTVTVGQ